MRLAARDVLALLFSLVAWVYGCAALLVGGYISLARCYVCDGDGWRGTPDAWQWNGFVALGGAAFVAATGLVIFVWRQNRAHAAAAALVGLAAVGAFVTAASPRWYVNLGRFDGDHTLAVLTGLVAPLAALLLARRRSD